MLLQTYRYGSAVLYYNPKYFLLLLSFRIFKNNWLIGIQFTCHDFFAHSVPETYFKSYIDYSIRNKQNKKTPKKDIVAIIKYFLKKTPTNQNQKYPTKQGIF